MKDIPCCKSGGLILLRWQLSPNRFKDLIQFLSKSQFHLFLDRNSQADSTIHVVMQRMQSGQTTWKKNRFGGLTLPSLRLTLELQ